MSSSRPSGGGDDGCSERSSRLELLLAHVPDAVVAIDTTLRITEWNPAAVAMFGWSREEQLGRSILDAIPKERHGVFHEVFERLRDGDSVEPYESVRLNRDGSRHPVLTHPAALWSEGAFVGGVAILRDPTERQRLEARLARLLEAMPVTVACFDDLGTVTYVAGGAVDADAPLAVGFPLSEELAPGSALHQAVQEVLSGGAPSDLQVWFRGQLWQCHVGVLVEEAVPGGVPLRTGFLTAVDVTAEQRVEERLSEVLAAAPMAVTSFDAEGMITHAAGSGYALLGIDPATTLGENLLELYGDNADVRTGTLRCLSGSATDVVTEYGDRIWQLHFRPYRGGDGSMSGGVIIAQDATSWLALGGEPEDAQGTVPSVPEPLLEFLDRDEVTGLPGRRALQKRLLARFPAEGARAVAVLNVDGFAAVNETYGADVGDSVLRALGERLEGERGTAVVGRWHADEFLVVLEGPDAPRNIEELTSRLLAAAREPFSASGGGDVELSMCAGLASTESTAGRDLLPAAHTALRAAKSTGRDRFAWYDPQRDRTAGGPGLARELQTALATDQLLLHFQPIVSLADDTVISLEALVRWQHPERGLLPPYEFIEMAERTGLIGPLGRWVLGQATRVACELVARVGGIASVAVNLSARQLADPHLVDHVTEALEHSSCAPSALVLEVTETALLADMELAVATMVKLKELGVQLALDDFGTGYSSLLYLKHFPVDKLKIDRSFVSGLGTSPNDSAIVASTVSLARTMGIDAVAEGVETMSQLTLLTRMGCDQAQGFLFSRPLPIDRLLGWLHERPGTSPRRSSESRETGPAVTIILQLHAEAASLHTIAAAVNAAGHRTSRGMRWSAQSVALVIAEHQYPSISLPR
ncbi:MAG TPA: EAL domain-containing protein [Mycobacteriales bacterium]|nr:EAL domain-containing protein [Mycobacteriales bacterium]